MAPLARLLVGSTLISAGIFMAGPAGASTLPCDVYANNCATPTPSPTSDSGEGPIGGGTPTPVPTVSVVPTSSEEPVTGETPTPVPTVSVVPTSSEEPVTGETPTPPVPTDEVVVPTDDDDDAPVAAQGSLPLTGGQLVLGLMTGLGAVGAGAALVVVSRRRATGTH